MRITLTPITATGILPAEKGQPCAVWRLQAF